MAHNIKYTSVNLTCKIKPKLNNIQANLIHKGAVRFTKALNYDSAIYENHNQDLKVGTFHRLTYHPTQKLFGIKSFMSETARRLVQGTYQSINSQRRKTVYDFPDKNCFYYIFKYNRKTHCVDSKKYYIWHKCHEDSHWLWHRVHFHRNQLCLLHGYDWSIKKFDKKHHMILLSIVTIRKHISKKKAKKYHIKPQKARTLIWCWIPKYFRKYFHMNHKLNMLRILRCGNKIWFHIGLTLQVKALSDLSQATNIYGSDRGQRFIGWIYDSHKHSIRFRGLPHRRKRRHLLKIHSNLQYKHNKLHSHSALMKMASLKRTRYGNGYMNDINNQISKTQVSCMKSFSVIGYENLADIRSALENAPKKHRYTMVSWSFGDYGKDVQYKALLYKGIIFVHVPAYNTSNRDPLTGRVNKANRHHNIHTYLSYKKHENSRHYAFNDDLVGAMNIQFLTTLLCIGYIHPTILDNGCISYRSYYKKNKKIHYKVMHLGRIQAIKIYKQFNKKHFVGQK